MDNGTTTEDLRAELDLVFEEFYNGLYKVAGQVSTGGSPEDIAKEIEDLAREFCKHWPTCRRAHLQK